MIGFNHRDSEFFVSKDGIVALAWKNFKVVMFLRNCVDPSSIPNAKQREKGKLKCSYPDIFKSIILTCMTGVDIHDKMKTTYELDQKVTVWYHLRIFFDLMDSVAVKTHIIYKKELNGKVNSKSR